LQVRNAPPLLIPADKILTHFSVQNHSFDLGNEDAEEEERWCKKRLLPMLIIVKDNKFGKESIMLTIPSPCIAPRN